MHMVVQERAVNPGEGDRRDVTAAQCEFYVRR